MNDGRPFWVGDFGGDGIDEMLFYFPNDDNWWMGRFFPGTSENPGCAQLRRDIANLQIAITELKAEQTAAVNSDDRAVLKKLKAEIMAAEAQLASTETQLTQAGCAATAPSAFGQLVAWQFVGNTIGYGACHDVGRPPLLGLDASPRGTRTRSSFITRRFGHWHRGILTGNTMVWSLAGTTNLSLGLHLFSNNAGHAWAGDFDGDGLTELVYRVTNSPNFWMFDFSATAVTGSQVYAPPTHQTTVKVPSVVGDSLTMASNVISGASLKPNVYSLDGSLANQIVVSQDPAGGATVQQGAHINLGCVGAGFGVSTLHFFNCSEMKLHLWTSDDGDRTWHDEDTLDRRRQILRTFQLSEQGHCVQQGRERRRCRGRFGIGARRVAERSRLQRRRDCLPRDRAGGSRGHRDHRGQDVVARGFCFWVFQRFAHGRRAAVYRPFRIALQFPPTSLDVVLSPETPRRNVLAICSAYARYAMRAADSARLPAGTLNMSSSS